LGIPVYGYHWFAGDPGKDEKPNPSAEYIGQQDVDQYVTAYHPHVEWDAFDRVAWFYFYKDDNREWVFYTDKRGFLERWNLAATAIYRAFVRGCWEPRILKYGWCCPRTNNDYDFANACFAAAIVC